MVLAGTGSTFAPNQGGTGRICACCVLLFFPHERSIPLCRSNLGLLYECSLRKYILYILIYIYNSIINVFNPLYVWYHVLIWKNQTKALLSSKKMYGAAGVFLPGWGHHLASLGCRWRLSWSQPQLLQVISDFPNVAQAGTGQFPHGSQPWSGPCGSCQPA